jgi:hypothetical protein
MLRETSVGYTSGDLEELELEIHGQQFESSLHAINLNKSTLKGISKSDGMVVFMVSSSLKLKNPAKAAIK